MSVQALTCAFAVRGLSASEKLLLLALANYANEKMACWPSQERLAADTELSERTIWAGLKSLEAKRLLSRQGRKRPDGTRSTDVITLHFFGVVAVDPLANFAKPSRNSCETQSQILPTPVATIAAQNLSITEPSEEEPGGGAVAPPSPKAKPSRRCPEAWGPSARTLEILTTEGFTAGEIERALTRMRDCEFRVARSDWDACLRNWVREDQNRVRTNGQRPHPLHPAQTNTRAVSRGIWAEVLAEEAGEPIGRRTGS